MPTELDPLVFIEMVTKQMREYCPAGIIKCECIHAPGKFTEGPFYADEDLLGTLLTYATCNPGFCFCKDAPEKEVDTRYFPLFNYPL